MTASRWLTTDISPPSFLALQDDINRLVRLNQASASLAVGDEYSGAGTGNELQALVRQEKAEKLARARTAAAEAAAAEEAKKAAKQAAPAVPGEQVLQKAHQQRMIIPHPCHSCIEPSCIHSSLNNYLSVTKFNYAYSLK